MDQNVASSTPPLRRSPRLLTGRLLDKRSWRHDPTAAALLAADLVSGFVVFDKLTLQQALRLTGANLFYVQTALKLSPSERAELEAGRVTLSALAQGQGRKRCAVPLAAEFEAIAV